MTRMISSRIAIMVDSCIPMLLLKRLVTVHGKIIPAPWLVHVKNK